MEIGLRVELPFQEGSNFKKFNIQHRNTESVEHVKRVLCSLEKDALLLDFIPIAFDDDLEIKAQLTGLFTDKVNSVSTIWDFILKLFRFFGELVGLYKFLYDDFQRLDKYFVEHSAVLIEDDEAIIDFGKQKYGTQ